MNIQFSLDGRDITNEMYAYTDADEVRVWDGEQVVIAVQRTDTGDISTWEYAGSDMGHALENLSGKWDTWEDAIHAYSGIDHSELDYTRF